MTCDISIAGNLGQWSAEKTKPFAGHLGCCQHGGSTRQDFVEPGGLCKLGEFVDAVYPVNRHSQTERAYFVVHMCVHNQSDLWCAPLTSHTSVDV